MSASKIEAAILAMAAERAPKTLCPSDVARRLESDEDAWRALMPKVREVAQRLAKRGEVVVTQRGEPVDAVSARGPVRIGAGRSASVRPEKK